MATFTPGFVVDPATGEERVSYDHGTYDSGEGRDRAIAYHMGHQMADYVVTHDGAYHEWAELDPERYQQYEEDYVDPNAMRAEYESMPLAETDIEELQGIVGGSEEYRNLIAWAAENISEENIADYDRIMDSGDAAAIESAVRWLYSQYLDKAGDEEDSDSFVEQTYQAVGGHENYAAMMEWAKENLSDEAIAEYDTVMETGDDDLRSMYVQRLVEMYQAAY